MVWPYLVSPLPPVLHGGSSVRLSPATEPPRIAETCPQPEPVMAIENEGVTLNCMLRGNPRPTVVWTFRNATLRAGDRFSFSNRRSQLTISEVEMRDGGVYTCTATNTAGQDVYEFLLEVQGRLLHSPSPFSCHNLCSSSPQTEASSRPFFRHQPPPITDAIAGSTARLPCEADGFPTPSISWFKAPLEADTPVIQVYPSPPLPSLTQVSLCRFYLARDSSYLQRS